MSTNDRDIARFLAELHERLDQAAQAEQDFRRQQQALEAREQSLAKEWERRETAKLKEVDQRLQSAVAGFEAQAQDAIQKVLASSEQRKAVEQAERKLSKTRRELELQARVEVFGETSAAKKVLTIEVGDRIRLKGVREPARVRRKMPGDLLEVDAGLMKMQVSTDDVEEVLPAASAGATRLPKNVSYEPGPTWDVSYREINVIGQRAEEARDLVDKFLDSAAMASVDRVRIVHGHGMGILRKVIAELLTTNPHVEKFYAASPSEGGTGATVVELK
jgi:DNA mismatch repair protein MutS2